MQGTIRFWVDLKGQPWMTLTVEGDIPDGWGVPYADLVSDDLVSAFAVAPDERDGLVPGRRYQMNNTLTRAKAMAFVDSLHSLVARVRPTPIANNCALTIEDIRTYE